MSCLPRESHLDLKSFITSTTGHVRSGDVNVDAKIRHTWGDDVTLGVNYKNDILNIGGGANLVSFLLFILKSRFFKQK